jgi:hypothetical protein
MTDEMRASIAARESYLRRLSEMHARQAECRRAGRYDYAAAGAILFLAAAIRAEARPEVPR